MDKIALQWSHILALKKVCPTHQGEVEVNVTLVTKNLHLIQFIPYISFVCKCKQTIKKKKKASRIVSPHKGAPVSRKVQRVCVSAETSVRWLSPSYTKKDKTVGPSGQDHPTGHEEVRRFMDNIK